MSKAAENRRIGSTDRFTEDLCFTQTIPPQTFGGLLNRLKLSGKPEYLKRRRVNRWLRHNTPSTNLSYFLNAMGYDVELPGRGS